MFCDCALHSSCCLHIPFLPSNHFFWGETTQNSLKQTVNALKSLEKHWAWKVSDGGRQELTSETWRPLEYKQSRREESEKSVDSVGSVIYEDVDVYGWGLVVTLCTLEVFLENCLLLLLLFLLLLLLLLLPLVKNKKGQCLCCICLVSTSHTNMQITKHINYCLFMRLTCSRGRQLMWFVRSITYLDTALLIDVVSSIGWETVCSCCVVLPNCPNHPPSAPVVPHHPLHFAVEEAVGEADDEALRRRDHGLHGIRDGHNQGNPNAPHGRVHQQG